MHKWVTIKGEEFKAHMKKKQDADSSDKREPSDDDRGGYNGRRPNYLTRAKGATHR